MIIDPEFKALIPPLSDEERVLLEQSLLSEGCRDALVVWRDTLIDGHNRYELCSKHGIEFKTVERDFQDRNEALTWIIQNQLGRRNISDYTRGRLALRLEGVLKANGKAHMSNGGKGLTNLSNLHNTRAELAKTSDLSEGTIAKVRKIETAAPDVIKQAAEKEEISIHKAYEITKALETVKEVNPKFHEETIARGHILNLDGEDVPLVEADPTLIRVMSSEDERERVLRWQMHKTKIVVSSESNEWYTPAKYVDAARRVMGSIDLDPASCKRANDFTVRAAIYYTKDMNGLTQTWRGNVWLNPPYGSDQTAFVERLLGSYQKGLVKQAVLLVNSNVTDTKWFAPLWDYTVCFTDHRINFESEHREQSGSTHGSCFVYLGLNEADFIREFRCFGVVVKRVDK